MSEEQKMIIDATANMPVNQLREILTYIRYIQYKSMKTDVPERLIVKDEEELAKKLQKGIDDIKNGKVHTFEEVYSSSKAILEN